MKSAKQNVEMLRLPESRMHFQINFSDLCDDFSSFILFEWKKYVKRMKCVWFNKIKINKTVKTKFDELIPVIEPINRNKQHFRTETCLFAILKMIFI